MKRDVVEVGPEAGPRIVRPVCTNCNQIVDRATILYFGISDYPVKLCDQCLGVLRKILTRRVRPRRPMSARARRVLALMAQTPAEHGSFDTIARRSGGYAYHVIRSLLERGLLEQVAGETIRGGTFALTPAGLEAAAA